MPRWRSGEIDVKDAYSTDAKIGEYDLVTLEDDLHFFPQYKAVFLYRNTSAAAGDRRACRILKDTIDETRMIRLNAEAERTKNYARAARLYFRATETRSPYVAESFAPQTAALDFATSRARRHFAASGHASSEFRSAFSPAAAAPSGTLSLASPE